MKKEGWEPALEAIVKSFAGSLVGEGGKFLQARAFAAGVRVIRGIRGLLLVHYLIQGFTFMAAASFLACSYLALEQYSSHGAIQFTWPLAFFCGVFAIAAGVLALTLNERLWVRAFGLQELVENLTRSGSQSRASAAAVDPEALAELVAKLADKAVERRLRQLAKQDKIKPAS